VFIVNVCVETFSLIRILRLLEPSIILTQIDSFIWKVRPSIKTVPFNLNFLAVFKLQRPFGSCDIHHISEELLSRLEKVVQVVVVRGNHQDILRPVLLDELYSNWPLRSVK
jgi:hypothetical protein